MHLSAKGQKLTNGNIKLVYTSELKKHLGKIFQDRMKYLQQNSVKNNNIIEIFYCLTERIHKTLRRIQDISQKKLQVAVVSMQSIIGTPHFLADEFE